MYKLKELQEKIKPFLPIQESLTESADQCPTCSSDGWDYFVDSEDCYKGDLDEDYNEICDDDEFCGMNYLYYGGYLENGDRLYYCAIERTCLKLEISLKKFKVC